MSTPAAGAPPVKRLYRSRTDRKLGGVCGGLAAYFDLDPVLVRVVFVVLSIFPGSIIGGLIVYLLMVLIVPNEPDAGAVPHHAPLTAR